MGNCMAGDNCININGIGGQICMPTCKGYGASCPKPSAAEATTATPQCDACVNVEKPDGCILACNATKTATGGFAQAECSPGSTCKPLTWTKTHVITALAGRPTN